MKHKILLVDDDTEVLALNQSFFEQHGYLVATASSAKEALSFMKKNIFSCIVLDVMMPNTDGLSFCKIIREFSDVPIIFLSGKVEEEDRINGLLAGADDYMTKPYSLRELAARIEVNIRRHEAATLNSVPSSSTLSFPPLEIQMLTHKVFWNGSEIPLSNREFDLLSYLATNAEQVCTFQQIGEAVWGGYLETDRRSIMVNVSRLRKKLESFTNESSLIESVWSKGYCFKAKGRRS